MGEAGNYNVELRAHEGAENLPKSEANLRFAFGADLTSKSELIYGNCPLARINLVQHLLTYSNYHHQSSTIISVRVSVA